MNGENPLGRDFRFLELIRFALPTICVMVFMGLYTIVDTIFVARLVGEDALASINIACPVINVTVGLASMLATGGSAIVARKMGAGRGERARRDFTLVVSAGATLGTAIALFGRRILPSLVRALGASETLFPYCAQYLGVLLAFAPACVLQVLFQNLIVTAGRPKIGMALALCSGGLNIALDAVFMGPMRLGVAGAALGTGFGYLLPVLVGIVFFSTSRGPLRFARPVLDVRVLTECLANGSSEMVGQLAAAITTFLFNASMMRLVGETGVAAITIIIFSQFLLSSLHFGFSMGVAPVISYNYGSGNIERLNRILRTSFMFAAAVSVCVWACSTLFGDSLVGVFSPPGTALRELAGNGFRLFAVSFLFSGVNIFVSAAFTALSDGRTSALVSFLRTFGFLALFVAILPKILGMTGVWLAIPAAEFLTFAVSAFFIRRLGRRLAEGRTSGRESAA